MSFPSKVLDGLLAQCGTVENCEQGEALKNRDHFELYAVKVVYVLFRMNHICGQAWCQKSWLHLEID